MTVLFITMLWWTVAVVLCMSLLSEFSSTKKEMLLMAVVCICWPLFTPFAVVILLYDLWVSSVKRIRIDIENRGLMKEFEEFIKLRNNGKILPKENNTND